MAISLHYSEERGLLPMKKIIACIIAASLLLVAMTVMEINPERFDSDSVFVDDESGIEEFDQQSLYDELFDFNSVVQIDVNISKEELAKIQQDYDYYLAKNSKSPIYRKADSVTFTINGKKYVIEEVGIRMKGGSSRTSYYNDILGIYNIVSFKLSFDQAFDDARYYSAAAREWKNDEEREKRLNRTFATLKSLELKWNSNADNTYVRSTYMEEMFKDFGICAQKCRLADCRIGGCKMGVYRFLEPVDEIFIRRYMPEEDWGGDLYKARCTQYTPANYSLMNTYGMDSRNNAVFYNFDLKTNQQTSNHESIKRLIDVVNKEGVTREELDEVADVDSLALFCAINFAAGNLDDMRNNYNNHYVYFRKSDGKAYFIPYDCEVCLGITVYGIDPSGGCLTDESPYVDYNYRYKTGQENKLVRQIVLEGGYYVDQYTAYLKDICQSKWLTEENYLNYYSVAEKNYSDSVVSPYNFLSTVGKNMEFSMNGGENYNGNMSIDEFMTKMRANVDRYISQ